MTGRAKVAVKSKRTQRTGGSGMSVTDNRRPVLVADRRYVAAQKAASGSGGGKRMPPAAKAKSAPRRRPPKRNPVTGFFGGILRWILRVIWVIGCR